MGLFDHLTGVVEGDGSPSAVADDETAASDDGPRAGDDAGRAGVASGRAADEEPAPRTSPRAMSDAAQLRVRAERFVRKHDDANVFDFTLDSLQPMDRVVDRPGGLLDVVEEMGGRGDLVDRMDALTVLETGSYLGETLVRDCRGVWRREDGEWVVALPVADGERTVHVFAAARHALDEEGVFTTVAERVANWHDRASPVADDDSSAAPDRANRAEPSADRADESTSGGPTTAPNDGGEDATAGSTVGGPGQAADRDASRDDPTADAQTGAEEPASGGGSSSGEPTTADGAAPASERGAGRGSNDSGEPGQAADRDGSTDDGGVASSEDASSTVAGEDGATPAAADQDDATAAAADQQDTSATGADQDDASEEETHPAANLEAVVGGLRADADRFAERHDRYRLDGTPASLARLDECCASAYASLAAGDADERELTTRAMETGGYFGVVLADVCEGEWVLDDGTRVVIEGATARARIDPVAVATAVLRGEDSFADTYGAVRRQLALDVPAVDPASARDAIRPAVAGVEAPSREAIDDLAAELCAAVPAADPDHTPASLYRLDEAIPDADGLDAQCLGAYLGGVVVSTHGATWTAAGDGGWVVALPDGSGDPPRLDPVAAARSVLAGDATLADVHDSAYETIADGA